METDPEAGVEAAREHVVAAHLEDPGRRQTALEAIGDLRRVDPCLGAQDQGFRDGLDLETAAETVFSIGSPEVYRLLTLDRGWSGSRFEDWYADTLERLLLDRPTSDRP